MKIQCFSNVFHCNFAKILTWNNPTISQYPLLIIKMSFPRTRLLGICGLYFKIFNKNILINTLFKLTLHCSKHVRRTIKNFNSHKGLRCE